MIVSRKNISRVLHDVQPPASFSFKSPLNPPVSRSVLAKRLAVLKHTHLSAKSLDSIKDIQLQPDSAPFFARLLRHKRQVRETLPLGHARWELKRVVVTTVLLLTVLYGLSLYGMRNTALQALYEMDSSLTSAIQSFRVFKTDEAAVSLGEAERNLKFLREELGNRGFITFGTFVGAIFPAVRDMRLVLEGLETALGSALVLNNGIAELKESGFSYFVNGKGGELTSIIRSIQEHLERVIKSGETLERLRASLADSVLGHYVTLPEGGDVALFKEGHAAYDFLAAILDILSSKEPVHILILFQNPSEMRPSGGFIGSYAVLTVKDGAMGGLDVRDIYDPDGWVVEKIIPPRPLQVTTINWEARDANWFLDFRTSAEKVISRLQNSLFYKEKGIAFAGAIAINTDVLKSLLQLTGPIYLPEYDLSITYENFLEEVQYEIEAGRNKKKNQPKKILSDITPKLLSHLGELYTQDKDRLIRVLGEHLTVKDIQIYFKEKKLEQFMEKYGVAGAVFEIPQNWNGDYLAVVNANIAGGKTDAYMEQGIFLDSVIDEEGRVSNVVKIERDHRGGETPYFWYNVTNKSYIRILTPPNTQLTEINGETKRTVQSPINYNASSYTTDQDVALLEREGIEHGKNMLAAWSYVNPGETREIAFSYKRDFVIEPKSGAKYQFVFDKQSGVKGGISYTVQAPPGFRWRESESPIFEYKNESPPARIIIDLTLEEV